MSYFDLSWLGGGAVLVVLAVLFLVNAIRIFREYERGVVFTLGRFWQVKGPGRCASICARWCSKCRRRT